MLIEQGVVVWHSGFTHLREGTSVHCGGLDVQHHPVYQRFGSGHKTYPQPEIKRHTKT